MLVRVRMRHGLRLWWCSDCRHVESNVPTPSLKLDLSGRGSETWGNRRSICADRASARPRAAPEYDFLVASSMTTARDRWLRVRASWSRQEPRTPTASRPGCALAARPNLQPRSRTGDRHLPRGGRGRSPGSGGLSRPGRGTLDNDLLPSRQHDGGRLPRGGAPPGGWPRVQLLRKRPPFDALTRAIAGLARTRRGQSSRRRCALSGRRGLWASSLIHRVGGRERETLVPGRPGRVQRPRRRCSSTAPEGRRPHRRHLSGSSFSSFSVPLRMMAYIAGFGGGREEGLAMMEAAASHSSDAQTDARFALVIIYNRERRYTDALRVLGDLERSSTRETACYGSRQVGRRFEQAVVWKRCASWTKAGPTCRPTNVRECSARKPSGTTTGAPRWYGRRVLGHRAGIDRPRGGVGVPTRSENTL